ncbi:hypothetical protein HPP92_017797 [Vanilla planifolia]|uniref:Uncharacterized protein n=1 Tax=Vanilla planifolia TaxID=51239 RepID=A0A835Q9Y0_VANPL|nr:hypothetical protein HPP92_017797 [Vanilla planifolia]
MAEACNSRGLSWFAKSCITDSCEKRFSLLLDSPAFLDIRRSRGHLRRSLLVLHISDLGFLTASTLRIPIPFLPSWSIYSNLISSISDFAAFSHPRVAAIGRVVYIIGRGATLRYDSLTGAVSPRAAPIFARKKFAVAAISDRIYVAGGSSRTSAVEEYDPETDSWRVVTEAPRRRYGCVGAAVGSGRVRCGASPVRGGEPRGRDIVWAVGDGEGESGRGLGKVRAAPVGGAVGGYRQYGVVVVFGV